MSNFSVGLTSLVCSFDYAKKLRDAGVKLSTWFYWQGWRYAPQDDILKKTIYYFKEIPQSQREKAIPAPTSGELDLILHQFGFKVYLSDSELYDPKTICEDGYYYTLEPLTSTEWEFTIELIFQNAADAKADGLLWLINEKIVDPKAIGV